MPPASLLPSRSARRFALRAAVALGLLSVSLSAFDASADDKTAKKSAKKMEDEGKKALAQKDYPTALQKFRGAESLYHASGSTLGMARAQVGLNQLAQAQKTYTQLMSEAKTLKPPPPPEAAKEAIALAKRVPHVTIAISGATASQATVTIDGDTVPSDSFTTSYAVDPGAHLAHGEAPGDDPVDVQFTVGEADLETVTLKFQPSAPVAAAAPVDGNASHHDGGHTRRTIGEVILVGGIVGLGFGVVTGVLAMKKHSSLSSECPNSICTASNTSAIEAYHTDGSLSTVGFVAGGALTVLGAVLTFLPVEHAESDAPPPPKAGFRFQPLIGPGSIGARGEF